MDLKIKRNKIPLLFKIFVIIFIIGTPVTVIGIAFAVSLADFEKETVEIVGVISKIENPGSASKDELPTVYVTYDYDGQTYRDIKIPSFNKSMRLGDTIDLVCFRDEPDFATVPGMMSLITVILLLVGLTLMLLGGLPLIVRAVLMVRNKTLLNRGVKIEAVVDEITRALLFLPYSLQPYRVYCRYNGDDGKVFRFVSFYTWYNPNLAFSIGSYVPVYVNKKNAVKYYVDLRSVMRGKVYDLAC